MGELKRDAVVVADATATQHSEAALLAIQGGAAPGQTGIFKAIQGLAPEKPPETPAEQVVQLVDAPGAEVDRELLEIFLEEATEVLDTIEARLGDCREVPHDRDGLTTIRRSFHTLKGSGRMVGLMELGEMAWQCEQVMNKWLKDEKPASAALLGFIGLARQSFAGWVDQLKSGGTARIEGAEILRQAEALKSGEDLAAPAAPIPVATEAAVVPQAPVSEPAHAVPMEEPIPVAAETPPALPAAPAPAPEFSFESLDLAPAAETQSPVVEPATPTADEWMPTAEAAPSVPAAPEAPEESDVVIGEASIPRGLFAIYLIEAQQHAAMLEEQMARLEADPMLPVSAEFMRAAHTLSSSSRTTGLDSVAEVAHSLEKWLQEAIELPPEFDAARLASTRRAVEALIAMVQSVRGQAPPHTREDVIEELERLREGLRAARRTGEGTHIRIPGTAALLEPAPVEEVRAAEESTPSIVEDVAAAPVQEPSRLAAQEPPPAAAPEASIPVAHEAPLPAVERAIVPEAEAPLEAGKEQRRVKDDVDRDLLPIFLEEAREIVPAIAEGVRRWRGAPADRAPVADLTRHLHTLKGSARMSGLMRLGELAHVIETRLAAMDASRSPTPAQFDEVEERVDRFSHSLERLARGEDIVEAIEIPVAAVFEQQRDKPTALAVIAAAAQQVANREQAPEVRESRAALLRVNADMIDRFVNDAGELSIARSRIEGEMATFKRALVDLTENIGRMRSQLREIELASEGAMQSTLKAKEEHGEKFDPLELDRFSRMQELTRFLAESLGDVITLHQGLQKNLDETELAIHAQARLNRELQQGLMGVRLVPLGNLSDRFYRIVRQTAKELGKKANLELKGSRVELDRSVLEKITGPFEHLLRNAIAHGLESPAARVAAGKAEIGEISLEAQQRGNEVVMTVADDGGGLDFARIRAKAIEAGLLAPDVELPEAQLAHFIFVSGFSTATEVSQISGRGVGLDVVKNEITALGGRVEIASTSGRGTIFTITLPLTLAVTQAVMLRSGQFIYAVPSVMVEQVQEYKAQPFAELAARGEVVWKDNRYALRSLLPLLGEVDTPTPARQIPVLLLKSGVQRAAIRVDEIIGNREVVVKTIGPQLSRLAGIAGATVMGNGEVVLILNPVQLVHREALAEPEVSVSQPVAPAHVVKPAQPVEPAHAVQQKTGAALVMVVDDSLTVRKITGRMLAREGYEVASAKDGVDALQQLQDMKPQCILLDVEMPRMDGFEFARNVRADEATKSIPIIMITSRTADKHRNHALELGVNEYMGKPYQEEQLLALIKRYTSENALA